MTSAPANSVPRALDTLLGPGLAAQLDRLDFNSRKIFAGKLPGERRSKRRGRSVEFDDYRPYVAGDDLRHIDWNVLARLDRFFLKLFREDQDLSVHLVVDASDSMDFGEPNKRLVALRIAMALGYVGLANQNRVSLSLFRGPGRAMASLAAVRGRSQAVRLAGALLSASETRASGDDAPGAVVRDFNAAIRAVARTRTGRGVLVLITDGLHREGCQPALDALAGSVLGGFDAHLLHVLSPGELDPSADGLVGDLRLTDAETGRSSDVTLSAALLARYRTRVKALGERLRADCRARGISYTLVPSSTHIPTLVLDAMRRGGLLR